jgi:hypothetical protein
MDRIRLVKIVTNVLLVALFSPYILLVVGWFLPSFIIWPLWYFVIGWGQITHGLGFQPLFVCLSVLCIIGFRYWLTQYEEERKQQNQTEDNSPAKTAPKDDAQAS